MLAKISGALIKPGSISGDVLSGSLEINTVNVSGSLTGSDATFSGHITASALKGDGSAITGVLSSSYALSSSYTDAVEYTHILHKPTLVSSSAQFVTLTDPFSGSFTGSFKGDAANLTGTISSSYAVSSSNAGAIDYNNVYNRPTLVSSSAQFNSLTAPFTGSFTGSFKGDATTGYVSASNIYVSDTLTARQVMTRYVSSSIIYESGSTKFGDSLDDVHQVTGSMNITGSLTATFVSGTLSGAFPYSSLTGLPTLVSQSAQVDYNSIQNYVIAVTGSSVYTNTLTNTVNSNNSIFFGDSAGYIASQSIYSNFFGYYAGYQSYKAQYSNFFGSEAGREAPSVSYSNFLGYRAGYQATNASNTNFLGPNAGYIASQSNNANFLGASAGYQAYAADNSNFFGFQAGYQASQSNFSNYFGQQAGYQAYKGNYSNFLGVQAGYQASQSSYSNFLGQSAGNGASNAFQSNFFGGSAGYLAYSAQNSNFFGYTAGYQASQSNNANYIGYQAGYNAAGASNSNFFGRNAGYRAVNASYSTLIGYQAGYAPTTADSIGSNNIIIGTNITLPAGTVNAISLGNVIYVTGSYSTTSGNPSSASKTDGKVGIATFNPQTYIQVGDHTVAGVAGKGHIYVNGLNNVDDGFYVDRGVAGEYGWINYQGGSFTLGTKGSTGHGYFRILSYSGSTAVERVTIDNIGSVGIGTTSPAYKLDVNGTLGATTGTFSVTGTYNYLTINSSNSNAGVQFQYGGTKEWTVTNAPTSHDLIWYNASDAERMKLTQAGAATFAGTVKASERYAANTTTSTNWPGYNFTYNDNAFAWIWAQAAVGELRHAVGPDVGWGGYQTFFTDTVERLRITSTLADFTVPLKVTKDNGYGLTLVRSATNKYLGIEFFTGAASRWFVGLRESPADDNLRFYSEAGSDVLTLNQSTYAATFAAGLTATTGTFSGSLAGSGNRAVYSDSAGTLTNSSSDIKMKKNITTLEYSLIEVTQLNPVSYDWKEEYSNLGTSREVGLIAQEVQQVIPEVVYTNGNGMMGISYEKLTPVLINAIKEQQGIIDKQQLTIDDLNVRLSKLEG